MQYDQVNAQSRLAHIVCRGEFNSDAFIEAYKSGIDSAAKGGLRTVLIDTSAVTGPYPSTMDRYRIGSAVSDYQSRGAQPMVVAIVGREPYIDPERFGETVAQNRGGFVKAFTDERAAMVWLEKVIASAGSSRTT